MTKQIMGTLDTPMGRAWITGADFAHDGTPIVWLSIEGHAGYASAAIVGNRLSNFEVDGSPVDWSSVVVEGMYSK